jgi:predicted RecB family nuclease
MVLRFQVAELDPRSRTRGASDMGSKITREVLESYLHCKTKAHLKLAGQQGIVSDYEALLFARRQEVRQQAIAKILAKDPQAEVPRDIPLNVAALQSGPPFVLNATLEDDLLSLVFDGLRRVDGASKLGDFHYIPMLFHEGRKVGKEQRLLLELYGLLLSQVQGRLPGIGVIWHGPACMATNVRLNLDVRKTERLLREVKETVGAESPPKLLLNDHCQLCEFRQRCHDQAVQEDSISLLRGMGEKEIMTYARKGIFTVTQMAHTFRPRRKGKRQVQKVQRHYHALQALAIRDKRVYVFGTPELPASPVRIYLDMEGDPDEGYVYLIGMIVVQGETETRHSFWAESKKQEVRIFEEFLAEVCKYENFLAFSYGDYERVFLRRLRKRAKRKAPVDRVLKALVNTLSLIYSHVYFPSYSNGLKDVGACLGCSWTEAKASGTQSLVWRIRWETTHAEEWKRTLITYNLEDCSALRRVTEYIYAARAIVDLAVESRPSTEGGPPVAPVQEIDRLGSEHRKGRVRFFHPDFEHVSKCAHFDYQRQRVFFRTSKPLKKTRKRPKRRNNLKLRVNRHIEITSRKCPECGGKKLLRYRKEKCRPNLKRVFDLVFTCSSIRRRVIEYRASVHKCEECGHSFLPDRYTNLARHSHSLMSWAMYEHLAHRASTRIVEDMFKQYLGINVDSSEIHLFKSLMAHYYRKTCKKLLAKILAGKLLHVDETEVRLKNGKGYVWIFSNLEEVVFMYRPTREGAFLRKLLKDFRGVLISDFYTAYDSINCPQQKCLIHLLKDMNDSLLNNPFDEELQSITAPFGKLLRDIVDTIDQHGLKRSQLKKHEQAVAEYFQSLASKIFRSVTAQALQERLAKYKDKLFTFLQYDGVPWNNNYAENAVKQFVYYRELANGIMAEGGLKDYLVLLSICQSCKLQGKCFFKFLLSGKRDLDAFNKGRRIRKLPAVVDVYPKGLTHFLCPRPRSRVADQLKAPDQGKQQPGS